MKYSKLFAAAAFSVFAAFSVSSHAQQLTQEQIDQFRALPRDQQEALASSYGLDLDQLLEYAEEEQSPFQNEQISGRRGQALENDQQLEARFNEVYPDGAPIPEDERQTDYEDPTLVADETDEEAEDKIALFGHNLFEFGADFFAPNIDIPVPSNYVLGPGDSLTINLYGKENSTHTITIDRDGRVIFPKTGPVVLAGLTFEDARSKIDEIVEHQMIGIKSSVTLGELRSIRVFVLGEATIPGSYVVSSVSTLTNAIMASGGITEIGSLRSIQLKRNGETISELDLYDLLLNGDTSKDARLQSGDVIFIPPIGKTVSIEGDIKRPAIYELKSEKTLGEMIKLGGGPAPTAFLPATKIERVTADGEKTYLDVNASTTKGKQTRLNDGDSIVLASTLEFIDDVVELRGHAKRARSFKWAPDLRFTDLMSNVEGMKGDPDINVGLIRHLDPRTGKISVSIFSPIKAWTDPKGSEDPTLKNRDQVFVFSRTEDRAFLLNPLVDKLHQQARFNEPRSTVNIRGNTRFPGTYPYPKGMSAQDLITLSGGLLENSSEINAEITREIFKHDHSREQNHFAFDMRKKDPELREGDRLRVTQIPFWKEGKSVKLQGEVINPGTYSILPGETLTQVIERAGGLTPFAYIEGTTYSREDLRELERKQIENLKADLEREIFGLTLNQSESVAEISLDDAQRILDNLDNTEVRGLLVINLKDILNEPTKFDFELEDGDVITVPTFKPTVTVVGEVQHATSHFFDENVSFKEFVERSGGTKKNADKKRIYVVRANGQVVIPKGRSWFRSATVDMQPGDTIIVPLDAGKADRLKVWQSVTTIMYQAALGITALTRL